MGEMTAAVPQPRLPQGTGFGGVQQFRNIQTPFFYAKAHFFQQSDAGTPGDAWQNRTGETGG